ncbi:MAG: phosphotransferase family protein [Ectothiorhodospiraceae bacterium]|nr:phosphotransferase family protein [Ectothiorhodospiraceae bacterium]
MCSLEARHEKLVEWVGRSLGLSDVRLGRRLSGGNSNVTQLVEHREGRVIVRRPPDNAISASASNGVRREYAMLTAVSDTVRVPKPLAICEDPGVIGQPFIVVDFVDGVSITTSLPPAYEVSAETLNTIGVELIEGIAAAHRLDWRALPLRQPSRSPQDYVIRQIERWTAVRRKDAVRDLPLVEELANWLTERVPKARAAGVLHGDFHLDNTLFAPDRPALAAIIDWELATIGDPMADVGLLLAFWGERLVDSPGFSFVQAVTRQVPGVVSREELATRWADATGFAADDLDFYLVFALWRLATIVEGAFVLYRGGLVDDDYSRGLESDVPALLEEAAVIAGLR